MVVDAHELAADDDCDAIYPTINIVQGLTLFGMESSMVDFSVDCF